MDYPAFKEKTLGALKGSARLQLKRAPPFSHELFSLVQLVSEGLKIILFKNVITAKGGFFCQRRLLLNCQNSHQPAEEASSCGGYMRIFHEAATQNLSPVSPNPQQPLFHSNLTLHWESLLEAHSQLQLHHWLLVVVFFLWGRLLTFQTKTKKGWNKCGPQQPDNRLFIIPADCKWIQAVLSAHWIWDQ